jgi:hypothetical protein
MITILSTLVSLLSFRVRSRASLELELIALRHQVTVLRRQRPGQLRLFSGPETSNHTPSSSPLRPRLGFRYTQVPADIDSHTDMAWNTGGRALGCVLHLEIVYSALFSPVDRGGPDTRQIGLAVKSILIERMSKPSRFGKLWITPLWSK